MLTNEINFPHANVSTNESSNLGKTKGPRSQIYFPIGYFIREQYDKVLKMMIPPPIGSCEANAAAGVHALIDIISSDEVKWITNSGATHHITYYEKNLNKYKKNYQNHIIIKCKCQPRIKFM